MSLILIIASQITSVLAIRSLYMLTLPDQSNFASYTPILSPLVLSITIKTAVTGLDRLRSHDMYSKLTFVFIIISFENSLFVCNNRILILIQK